MLIGIYLVNRDRKITFWGQGAERITGFLEHEVIGKCCGDNILVHCDAKGNLLCDTECPLTAAMRDSSSQEIQAFLRHREGHRIPVAIRTAPLEGPGGVVIGAVETFDELTPHHASAPNVHLDEITGLPDSVPAMEQLRERIQQATETGESLVVLLIETDRLSHFREMYGGFAVHAALWVTGHTLSGSLRPADYLGRADGDRFLAILADTPEEPAREIAESMDRLVADASIPWWGDRISVTLSIGGVHTKPGETVESVLQRAAAALAESQAAGGNRVTLSERIENLT
jgi:diguanylate cyclase (GGDEF)-like protein/PAS domain S-box-containing protein